MHYFRQFTFAVFQIYDNFTKIDLNTVPEQCRAIRAIDLFWYCYEREEKMDDIVVFNLEISCIATILGKGLGRDFRARSLNERSNRRYKGISTAAHKTLMTHCRRWSETLGAVPKGREEKLLKQLENIT